MGRPQRSRRICCEPEFSSFIPEEKQFTDTVNLSTDEYEVIRIVDFEKQTHEAAAARMDISRTTATEIYESARYKIADCIVNGKKMVISGGNYRLCNSTPPRPCGDKCKKLNK